jgi:hypothetical protein
VLTNAGELELGVSGTGAGDATGIDKLLRAIALYESALPELTSPDRPKVQRNLTAALRSLVENTRSINHLLVVLNSCLSLTTASPISIGGDTVIDQEYHAPTTDIAETIIEEIKSTVDKIISLLSGDTIFSVTEKVSDIVRTVRDLLTSAGLPRTEWRAVLAEVIGQPAPLNRAAPDAAVRHDQAGGMRVLAPPLPEKALEIYADRTVRHHLGRKETIIEFLERVYGQWVRSDVAALTRPHLRRLDPGAEMALRNWLRDHNHTLPDNLAIPTKSEAIDRMVHSGSVPRRLIPRVGQTLARRKQRHRGPAPS